MSDQAIKNEQALKERWPSLRDTYAPETDVEANSPMIFMGRLHLRPRQNASARLLLSRRSRPMKSCAAPTLRSMSHGSSIDRRSKSSPMRASGYSVPLPSTTRSPRPHAGGKRPAMDSLEPSAKSSARPSGTDTLSAIRDRDREGDVRRRPR